MRKKREKRGKYMSKKGLFGMLAMGAVAIGSIATVFKLSQNAIQAREERTLKFKSYYEILNVWLDIKQKGGSLEKYFIDNGYKTIAIYGMGELGSRLYEELRGTSVDVKYAIDKDAMGIYADVDVLDLEDDLPSVDVIVVTAIFAYDSISENLADKISCPIVSLGDIVCSI